MSLQGKTAALLLALIAVWPISVAAQQTGATTAPGDKTARAKAPMNAKQLRQAPAAKEFSPQVAQAVLQELSAGLEDHDYDREAAIFDGNAFGGDFFRHMRAAFEYFSSFSVYYHLQSARASGDGATVEVDFLVQAQPQDAGLPPRRAETELTLELARKAPDGKPPLWRIVKMTPPDFLFSF